MVALEIGGRDLADILTQHLQEHLGLLELLGCAGAYLVVGLALFALTILFWYLVADGPHRLSFLIGLKDLLKQALELGLVRMVEELVLAPLPLGPVLGSSGHLLLELLLDLACVSEHLVEFIGVLLGRALHVLGLGLSCGFLCLSRGFLDAVNNLCC